ncbi:deoxyguanosinetriphosphate triphosphohydrolase-like protein [Bartonella bacilliformis Peru38]|uniref:Deoxyguanosinetriphosphate triphosphohydrolase-like protein n=2 Tax=Bartonella bacilliformis TaxID=774 RepID=A1USU4_BARBK|nr:deoxyguanosinetriphosphate triphosphohydrolase [Bartonella bacilliformis]ABM45465.1 deoxyguanosinetriphosphate triphosphohydrolase protein [Bartonella bacilliformis KC583]AMG85850.1 deoxyguanosinetriphosphate triphosphohydrolase [Bartonella bacilliformis]EKS44121.1 deoxyguanosinetriphosphate triphosphohydrolase-like protein [Bartonella bacilliformis INS]EYS89950.1 deoxyguanosinetriphosphate triphosphohydrolase-like protein [Bartonella bacilliformis San Pedro600-02]EYS95293.1 deoxyguanosinet
MNISNIHYQSRAIYSTNPQTSRGRLFCETLSTTRTPFQRDRDRIIHSNAFRRLKHKTQVFIADESDHYRTRLTHSIEVSQIARTLARALHLDEDLAEAIALVHDFGHPPFGHAGEEALDESMAPYGGFDHNAQTLRIVTKLEQRYANFDGLNLTWETLEGLVKHNGPLAGPHSSNKNIPIDILQYNEQQDLELDRFAGLEAQCAAIADDIAYNAHDVDDGLRSYYLTLSQFEKIPLTASLLNDIEQTYPQLDQARRGYELVRRQITIMVEDVIQQSEKNLALIKPQNTNDVHQAGQMIVTFSPAMAMQEKQLKDFLFKNLYYHDQVIKRRNTAQYIIQKLFNCYSNNPNLMPENWYNKTTHLTDQELARVISDFLSGMTDHYALREYQRLFDQKVDFV